MKDNKDKMINGRMDTETKDQLQERRAFDDALKAALRPNYVPGDELNRAILQGEKSAGTKRTGMKKWYVFPRVAVAAAAVVLIGSAGVYAAVQLLNKPTVTEHTVSVGNTEYVDDAAIAASEEPATTREISFEEGNENVKWTGRTVKETNGYTTTVCTYDSYASLLEDSGMDNWFTAEYPMTDMVYTVTEDRKASETNGAEGYRSVSIGASFAYKEGTVDVLQDRSEASVAEDAAFSIKLENTSNSRNYTAKSGLEFTLVDTQEEAGVTTTVLISYDNTNGYLRFKGLTDAEIQEVLETVAVR